MDTTTTPTPMTKERLAMWRDYRARNSQVTGRDPEMEAIEEFVAEIDRLKAKCDRLNVAFASAVAGIPVNAREDDIEMELQ